MISYQPLVETLKKKGIGIFKLQEMIKYNKLRVILNTGRYMDGKTLDKICSVLECKVEDVCEYKKGPQVITEKPIYEMYDLDVNKIRVLCINKEMPVTKISEEMGFSKGYLNAVMNKRRVGSRTLKALADYFKLDITEFIVKC